MKSYWAQKISVHVAQVVTVLLLLYLWQLSADHHVIDTFFFSSPSEIWGQIEAWATAGTLGGDISATLIVLAVGYACGMAGGLIIGVLTGSFKWIGELFDPFLVFLNAVPRLVLLPLFIVWFGFGYFPQIILVISVIMVVVAVNVAAGLREVRPELLQNARVMGASRAHLIRHVYVPSVTIWITATARVTIGLAFQAAIAAEFIGAAKGLGYLVVYGESTLKVAGIYAAMAIMIVIAVIIDLGLSALERRATLWMPRSG